MNLETVLARLLQSILKLHAHNAASESDAPAQRSIPLGLSRRAVLGWAAGVLGFALLYGAVLILLRRLGLDAMVTGFADRAGRWGALVLIVGMALAVMSPFPDSPIALAALVGYGPVTGLALVVAGAWIGAMIDFLMVRLLARTRVRRRFPRLVGTLDQLAARYGTGLFVVVRIVPTVSFDVGSYAAALTHLSTLRFAAATFVGLLIAPALAAAVGHQLRHPNWSRLLLAAVLLVTLASILLTVRVLRQRRMPASHSVDPPQRDRH